MFGIEVAKFWMEYILNAWW